MLNFRTGMMAAAALAAATPAAAAASSADTVGDVRCLMTMVVLGRNPANAQAGQAGTYFFGGRLNARDPNADIMGIMKAEAASLNGKEISDEIRRCGAILNAGMQVVQTGLNSLRPPTPVAPPAAPPKK